MKKICSSQRAARLQPKKCFYCGKLGWPEDPRHAAYIFYHPECFIDAMWEGPFGAKAMLKQLKELEKEAAERKARGEVGAHFEFRLRDPPAPTFKLSESNWP